MATYCVFDGHQDGTGAHGIVSEEAVIREATAIIIPHIRSLGHTVRGGAECHGMSIAQRADFANRVGADAVMEVHANAGRGTGSECFYAANTSLGGADLALHVANAGTGGVLTNRGAKPDTATAVGSLGILRNTDAVAVLHELFFIDNQGDVNIWNNMSHRQAICVGIANGFLQGLGQPTSNPKPADTTKPTGTKPFCDRVPCYTDHFGIWVDKIEDASGIAHVDVAVWTAGNGQDDLKWYGMAQAANDPRWRVSVDLKKHGRWIDDYICHVYATDKAGNQGFIGAVTVPVRDVTAKGQCTIEIAKPTVLANGSNTITIKDIKHKELAIDGVRVAVWVDGAKAEGKNWIGATKNKDGTYTATVDIAKLNHGKPGKYNVHVYGENKLQDKPNIYLGANLFNVYTQEQKDAEQDRLIADLQEQIK